MRSAVSDLSYLRAHGRRLVRSHVPRVVRVASEKLPNHVILYVCANEWIDRCSVYVTSS
jgi:hypothetical protein